MSGLRHKFDVDPALWDDANGWLVGPMRVRNNENDGACEKGACEYVVLDLYHDPHVAPALRARTARLRRIRHAIEPEARTGPDAARNSNRKGEEMNIAYSCLGRAWNLDPRKASTVGGDMDRVRLLMRLAWEHPEHNFVLVGRNSGEDPQSLGFPDNVINPWSWDGFKMPTLDYERIKQGPEFYQEYLLAWRKLAQRLPYCGEHIMWMGQHGGSNSPLPMIESDWEQKNFTTPQMAFVNYCGYLLDWCNTQLHIRPVTLCPDPRNYWKARELMAPLTRSVLAQYSMRKTTKWEQFESWKDDVRQALRDRVPGHREQSVYVTELDYKYAAVEMTALDDPQSIACATIPGAHAFGLISNENRKEVTLNRFMLVRDWLVGRMGRMFPLYGSWSDTSKAQLAACGIGPCEAVPAYTMYDVLKTFRSTITFPASGSGWATAKAWECFAAGTVCFFHPKYDEQGWIIPPKTHGHVASMSNLLGLPQRARNLAEDLAVLLRVTDPADLAKRVREVEDSDDLWHEITSMQREYFELAFNHYRGGALAVEKELGL